jgi:predicted nucleic acid-binding protein
MPFLVDANVLSELRKADRCTPSVRRWYTSVQFDELYLSVIVWGELRSGVEKLRRRNAQGAQVLDLWLRGLLAAHKEQILPVTLPICDVWARSPFLLLLPTADALIAATAVVHGLTVVTRNVRDFQRSGVDFINPFEA